MQEPHWRDGHSRRRRPATSKTTARWEPPHIFCLLRTSVRDTDIPIASLSGDQRQPELSLVSHRFQSRRRRPGPWRIACRATAPRCPRRERGLQGALTGASLASQAASSAALGGRHKRFKWALDSEVQQRRPREGCCRRCGGYRSPTALAAPTSHRCRWRMRQRPSLPRDSLKL